MFKVGHNRRTQTLHPGHKHIHSHYCVPAEGALIACESKVTPTCRATGATAEKASKLQIRNPNAKNGTHKMCFQGETHHSIGHALINSVEVQLDTVMRVKHKRWRQNKERGSRGPRKQIEWLVKQRVERSRRNIYTFNCQFIRYT